MLHTFDGATYTRVISRAPATLAFVLHAYPTPAHYQHCDTVLCAWRARGADQYQCKIIVRCDDSRIQLVSSAADIAVSRLPLASHRWTRLECRIHSSTLTLRLSVNDSDVSSEHLAITLSDNDTDADTIAHIEYLIGGLPSPSPPLSNFHGYLTLLADVASNNSQTLAWPRYPPNITEPICNPYDRPLYSLNQLRNWQQHYDRRAPVRPLVPRSARSSARRSRLLHCHDMMGGYSEDRCRQGTLTNHSYHFQHWSLIDAFVYFSHHCVTVPPVGWISASHKEGVPILGTLITEWDDGARANIDLLHDWQHYSEQLAQLALHCGFDGWLVNIEAAVSKDQIPSLIDFLSLLTQRCRGLIGSHSLVLMYDSVIESTGRVKWQSVMNAENQSFFTVCNGLFTDYHWKIDDPLISATNASDRAGDVWTGIDVYGRGTYGDGQWQSVDALKPIIEAGTSAALFAPGWTYEACGAYRDSEKWREVDRQFWLGTKVLTVPMTTSQSHSQSLTVDNAMIGWERVDGGNGWALVSDADSHEGYHLVTSYQPCTRHRVIDLHSHCTDIRSSIVVSQRYRGTGPNHSDHYQLSVKLLSSAMEIIDTFSLTTVTNSQWQTVKHSFAPHSDVRFVDWYECGNDSEGWSGHYGTAIGCGYVSVQHGHQPSIGDYFPPHRLSLKALLPLHQSFSAGAGSRQWLRGILVLPSQCGTRDRVGDHHDEHGWYNMSDQSVQSIIDDSIHRHREHRVSERLTVLSTIDFTVGYDGGSCLRLSLTDQLNGDESVDVPVLTFDDSDEGDARLTNPLEVSVTFAMLASSLSLAFVVVLDDGTTVLLGSDRCLGTSVSGGDSDIDSGSGAPIVWMTQTFHLPEVVNRTVTRLLARLTNIERSASADADSESSNGQVLIGAIVIDHTAPHANTRQRQLPVTDFRTVILHRPNHCEIQLRWSPPTSTNADKVVDRYIVTVNDRVEAVTRDTMLALLTVPYSMARYSMRVMIQCWFNDGKMQAVADAFSTSVTPIV